MPTRKFFSDSVTRKLREYCRKHPRAADTLDGVRGWLPAEYQAITRAELRSILESLVREGILTSRTLADGTVIYFSTSDERPV